jgi:uncharacterized SAM-binding protein YcdF (DUF218 family)
MFFVVSKLFRALLFPYPLLLILAVIASFKLKPGKFTTFFRSFLFLIIVFSTEIGSNALLWPLENWHPRRSLNSIPIVDSVVVLSGMAYPDPAADNKPEFNSAADRILSGVELVNAGKADHLLISGGDGSVSQTKGKEARALKNWLRDFGIRIKVLEESDSRNTFENGLYSAKILLPENKKQIVLVTSAFHMPRSVAIFEKQGFRVIPFPVDFYTTEPFSIPESYVPGQAGLNRLKIFYQEIIGILAYKLTSKL